MSHQTGKRVLTASTTLALAAVGLAASPIAAHAAGDAAATAVAINGCGTADTITITQAVDDPADMTAPVRFVKSWAFADGPDTTAKTVAAGASQVIKLADYKAAAYYPASDSTNAGKLRAVRFFDQNNAEISAMRLAVGAGLVGVTNAVCTIVADGTGSAANTVKAPAISPADAKGSTLTLYYQEGLTWTVNIDGAATTYDAAAFRTKLGLAADDTILDNAAYPITGVTGRKVTVTGTATDGNYVTDPSPFVWNFSADGLTEAGEPKPAVYKPGTGVELPAVTGAQWYRTGTEVTDVNIAMATAPVTGPDIGLAPGKTVRYWLIVDNLATMIFPDGTTYKTTDITNSTSVLDVPNTAVQFADLTGTEKDSVTVPVVDGAHFYYQVSASALTVSGIPGMLTDAALKSAGWTPLPEGAATVPVDATTKLPNAIGKYVAVLGVVDSPAFEFKKPASTDPTAAKYSAVNSAKTAMLISSAKQFTNGTVIVPAAPVVVDNSGADNDSYTFPALTPGVAYTVIVSDGSTTVSTVTMDDAKMRADNLFGKTVSRAQWGMVFGITAVNLSKDLTFKTSATVGNADAFPMDLDQTKAPWTATAYVGAQVTIPEPAYKDNEGATTAETVTFTKIDGIDWTYAEGADCDAAKAALGSPVTVTFAAGETTKAVSITAGKCVAAQAKPSAGSGVAIANPDTPGNAVKTFTKQFTAGKFAQTPAEPTASDLVGKDKDTYTIHGATGVDFTVNGAPFDAAKFNLPQPTNGALTVVVKATPATGYVFVDGQASKEWTLTFTDQKGPKPPTVTNQLLPETTDSDAVFSWASEGAASYTVTYQKQGPGAVGPELPWLTNTTATGAKFIAMAGDTYRIFVTAKDKDGNVSEKSSSDVKFPTAPGGPDTTGWIDLNNTTATYVGSWTDLRNVPQDYFNKSAMLGYNGAATITLPAGQKHFELYGTIWSNGGAGTLQVNGQNWADFNTRGVVAQPYQQMLRRLNLPDTKAPITIRIIPRNAGGQYLALDAFKYTAQ